MVHSFYFLFVINKPLNCFINTILHILLLFVSKLKYTFWAITKMFLNIKLYLLKNLTFDILLNLFLSIFSFLQSFIQNLIIASHHDNKIKPFWWKNCWTVKINNYSPIFWLIVFLNKFQKHFVMENGNTKFIIPFIIKFIFFYELSYW